MGCDIHTFIEYRKQSDTEWQDGNLYHRTHPEQQDTDDSFEKTFLRAESRNYELFAALANPLEIIVFPTMPRAPPETRNP